MNTAFAMDSVGDIFEEQEAATPLADRFAALRGLLSISTELAVPWRYYQEKMASRLEFMTQGRWGNNATFDAALEGAMKRSGLIGRPTLMLTCHLAEYRFWHGIRIFNSRTGLFFFDETIGQGLLGTKDNLSGSPTDLLRF
ncbi:hypothetical protein LVJ94_34045 [Pendulispora rubella]|uniref:Uncharacterized protein n=1 Tax=Pendulispora rubella TaxID=2741070 RepID=A0ABZ2KTC3_9BACT